MTQQYKSDKMDELIQLALEINQEFATLHKTMAEILERAEEAQKKAGD